MGDVVGIVPARSGSKGIPNKNLRELAGKPLLAYVAQAAEGSGVIDQLVLTTDSKEIADLGRSYGMQAPFLRPVQLAQDDTPMVPVLQHAVREIEKGGAKPEILVLLQPTSPLRTAEHIRRAVETLRNGECDSVVSVVEIPHLFSPQKALTLEGDYLKFVSAEAKTITRRQQLQTAYAREGTVYAVWRDVLMEQGSLYGDKCLPLILNARESLNLDTAEDWLLAEGRLLSTAGVSK
jgi:CMP-N-acetylneuraminic acid synthetase